jgi:hypothetical protein
VCVHAVYPGTTGCIHKLNIQYGLLEFSCIVKTQYTMFTPFYYYYNYYWTLGPTTPHVTDYNYNYRYDT